MQELLGAANRNTAAVDMRISASRTKVRSAIIPGEQRQAVLLDGEPLEEVDKFKHPSSMFVAIVRGTEEIRSMITLTRRKCWVTSLVSSNRTVKPRVSLSETWTALLVMPAQPTSIEHRHKCKYSE